MVLVMTGEPGFGGQSFLDAMLAKVRRTRAAADAAGVELSVQVDGGVSRSTIERAAEAGADNFVAGSAVFRAVDGAEVVEAVRALAARHCH